MHIELTKSYQLHNRYLSYIMFNGVIVHLNCVLCFCGLMIVSFFVVSKNITHIMLK